MSVKILFHAEQLVSKKKRVNTTAKVLVNSCLVRLFCRASFFWNRFPSSNSNLLADHYQKLLKEEKEWTTAKK